MLIVRRANYVSLSIHTTKKNPLWILATFVLDLFLIQLAQKSFKWVLLILFRFFFELVGYCKLSMAKSKFYFDNRIWILNNHFNFFETNTKLIFLLCCGVTFEVLNLSNKLVVGSPTQSTAYSTHSIANTSLFPTFGNF